MPKRFSVATWNVEHFKKGGSTAETRQQRQLRVQRVTEFIDGKHDGPPSVPDIFAIFEVEGSEVFTDFMAAFPNHRFHQTEGRQYQETLIGVRHDFPSFTTAKIEFKTQREFLRPGLLLTVRVAKTDYSLLFLHTKSGSNPEDFGLRDAVLLHAFNLKKALDNAAGGEDLANFLFVGDLNTMGIDDTAPYSKVLDLPAADEIDRLGKFAKRRGMTRAPKQKFSIDEKLREVTWWNGGTTYAPSNLDHVIAADRLKIRNADGKDGVSVFGWPRITHSSARKSWLKKFSDHALLYFEVWT